MKTEEVEEVALTEVNLSEVATETEVVEEEEAVEAEVDAVAMVATMKEVTETTKTEGLKTGKGMNSKVKTVKRS